ncbi:SufE family protein [Neochlamydia sp. EPS4]|uniref:SufE family protein n=1 Tax=Neochlamydia sp. EPS4 TaxID=1478175 RepID=UPI0005D11E49|nr:SufE family protein [Neochlamydia sp. EPS4]
MSPTFERKQNELKALFAACPNEESKYKKIIEMGRTLTKLEPPHKTSENIVKGCQSAMYLHSFLKEGNVYFEVESEALISAGLAALLVYVYNGETPESILTCAPTFLEDLGIRASLTPSRANGLYSVHLRMKQDALRLLTAK